jgi:hypothetical protein
MARRPAFDPSRLDDELDQLLPPPPDGGHEEASPVAQSTSRGDNGPALGQDAVALPGPRHDEPISGRPVRPARGGGGRPASRPRSAENESSAVSAVRIPKPLYDAVVHDLLAGAIERPSYAQIVAWTCEDRPDDVLAELARATTQQSRTPRGRKLAVEGVPLTLRFQTDERRHLDALLTRATTSATRITRTAGVVAALRVAVKHGLTPTGTAGER